MHLTITFIIGQRNSSPKNKIQSLSTHLHADGKSGGPQNVSGASQQNGVAAFSSTTDADGDFFKNMKWLHSSRSIFYVAGFSLVKLEIYSQIQTSWINNS